MSAKTQGKGSSANRANVGKVSSKGGDKRLRGKRDPDAGDGDASHLVVERIAFDIEKSKLKAELDDAKRLYKNALSELAREREAVASLYSLRGIKPAKIPARKSRSGRPEATAVLVCSDWHVEERVDKERCRGLNEFSLEIADRRITQLAQKASMLLSHEQGLTKIRRIVVACLGDFISGHIHDDLIEVCQLPPLAATRWAGERIAGVIDVMQEIAPVMVVTASGNHGRTTHKPRIATENDHSYEQHLYLNMRAQERRRHVSWQIGEGYLNVVDLDGFVLRAHHGHALKFGGGVGGLTIPANKAVEKWNQAQRADLDIFGHWHTFCWFPHRFVANGSLIGHNAFADRIKAEFQPPSQSLVIIDHEHNRVTKALPVFLT